MEQSAGLVAHCSRAVVTQDFREAIGIGLPSEAVRHMGVLCMHSFKRRPRSAIWRHSETISREWPWQCAHLELGLGKPRQACRIGVEGARRTSGGPSTCYHEFSGCPGIPDAVGRTLAESFING